MKLKDKIAIVTGGGRGIGRAIARRYAAEGAAVLVTARTQSECDAVVKEIAAAGGRAAAVAGDVSQPADCERIVEQARKQFARVDILVNNAGIHGPLSPVEDYPPDAWDEVLAVNLRSAFLLTRLVLPEMYKRKSGVVLNIASISGKAAFPWGSAYAASKAGLLALTRVTAAEAARQGVRVNAICPGPVFETRMSQEVGQGIAQRLGIDNETQKQGFLERILMGRAQTADEIAAAALFLASEEAAAITGQSLNVDGGTVFD